MLPGYHNQNKKHALRVLDVPVDFPRPELGIEYAENHGPYTIKFIVEKNQPRVVIPELNELPVEHAILNEKGNIFSKDLFGHDHYVGSPLGGI